MTPVGDHPVDPSDRIFVQTPGAIAEETVSLRKEETGGLSRSVGNVTAADIPDNCFIQYAFCSSTVAFIFNSEFASGLVSVWYNDIIPHYQYIEPRKEERVQRLLRRADNRLTFDIK